MTRARKSGNASPTSRGSRDRTFAVRKCARLRSRRKARAVLGADSWVPVSAGIRPAPRREGRDRPIRTGPSAEGSRTCRREDSCRRATGVGHHRRGSNIVVANQCRVTQARNVDVKIQRDPLQPIRELIGPKVANVRGICSRYKRRSPPRGRKFGSNTVASQRAPGLVQGGKHRYRISTRRTGQAFSITTGLSARDAASGKGASRRTPPRECSGRGHTDRYRPSTICMQE